MKKLIIASAIAASAVVSAPANAAALASSLLTVENFFLGFGNGAPGGITPLPANAFSRLDGSNNAIANVGLNGVATSNVAATNTFNVLTGDLNADVAQSALLGTPPSGDFSRASAAANGFATLGTAAGTTSAEVNIATQGTGNANSNTGVNSSVITSAAFNLLGPQSLQFSFLGAGALSAAAQQPFPSDAQASFSYTITLYKINAGVQSTVFSWRPDGDAGGITGGTEYSDSFNMNTSMYASAGDSFSGSWAGYFEAETGTLAAGSYRLTISHGSDANATYIPEPASLALVGLGLLGLGSARRRIKSA